jgi:beta-N-acetylhexosaminidase
MAKRILGITFSILVMLNSMALANEDLRQKIGQMIMVGFDGTSVPDTLSVDIEQRNLGGVILYGRNLSDPQQIKDLMMQLQQLAQIPLFIAIDQEGGRVARLDENNGFEETYTAFQLGTVFNSEDSTRATAAMMAQWLSESGVNVNLAPVVDVNVNPSSPAIGHWERSFSNEPMTVFNHAYWFVDEFHKLNIITTLKHFPGHGSAEGDSHLGFTDITTTWADSELIPYQEFFVQGYADLVMIGHLYNANLDTLYPASLSYNVITKFLRDSLAFQGLVISDEMSMRAISNNYSFDEAIELAINAGTDILLYYSNIRYGKSLVREIVELVVQKVSEGSIDEVRINESYQRILNFKQKIVAVKNEITNAYISTNFKLENYPNPFVSTTTIKFALSKELQVDLKIYDMGGRLIKTLINEKLEAGYHTVNWIPQNLQSGIYFSKIRAGNYTETKKIVLLK